MIISTFVYLSEFIVGGRFVVKEVAKLRKKHIIFLQTVTSW